MARLRAPFLPVVDGSGRLLGVVTERRLRDLLTLPERDTALDAAVATVIEPPAVALPETASQSDAEAALAEGPYGTVFVVDHLGRLVGALAWHDLLAGEESRDMPVPNAAGMATPFGVRLIAANVAAGVSSWGLVLGGACLGVLIAVAYLLVGGACYALDRFAGTACLNLWLRLDPPGNAIGALAWLAIQAAAALVFLVLLRATSLTGYHGAEHMVVHALERGEPLTPVTVCRMPRVHPRCGTNIFAAILLFASIVAVVAALSPRESDVLIASIVAALITLRWWRPLGAWLQDRLTTRTPTERQLQQAIAAGKDLRSLYVSAGWRPMGRLGRIWSTGMLQVAAGVFGGLAIPLALAQIVWQWMAR